MKSKRFMHASDTVRQGIIAGMAGGFAEIAWIASYGTLTDRDTTQVARTISAVVGRMIPGTVSISAPVAFGITTHMIAAVFLGVALVLIWQWLSDRYRHTIDVYGFLLAALVAVWAVNFFVVLPLISPFFMDINRSFVDIIPYPISLGSKLLFGLAAAATLRHHARDRSAMAHV